MSPRSSPSPLWRSRSRFPPTGCRGTSPRRRGSRNHRQQEKRCIDVGSIEETRLGEDGMRPRNDRGGRLGRRQLLRELLHGGGRISLGAVLLFGVDTLQHSSSVWAGPYRPPTPPAPDPPKAQGPPRPGEPPDKQTTTGITVRPDDLTITPEMAEYPGIVGPLLGYLAAPKGTEVYPGVLVIPDSQGLTEHFKDI